jgi:hypothetical protein
VTVARSSPSRRARWPVRAGGGSPLILAPGALPLALGLAGVPLLDERAVLLPVAGLGGFAILLYLVALVAVWPGALTWALGLLAAEYLLALELRGAQLDLTAPAYAAALFLCAELGWLGLEARRGGRPWLGRSFAIGVLTLLGAGLGWLLLLVAAIPLPGGALLTALGVAAAAAVAACLAWLARVLRA